MDYSNIINKVIKSVLLYRSHDLIAFEFSDGMVRKFSVEGDCCSNSWIEHLEMPNNINGAVLLSVEDSSLVDSFDDKNNNDIKVYNTVFNTNKGSIILEFRNSSNGYYGGYLVDAGTEFKSVSEK